MSDSRLLPLMLTVIISATGSEPVKEKNLPSVPPETLTDQVASK